MVFALSAAVIPAAGQGEVPEAMPPAEVTSVPEIDPVALGDDEVLHVVASTSIVGDVVSAVAGDRARVKTLMARGQNPHGYTPAPRDIAEIERADLVFTNGFDLEENLVQTVRTTASGPVVPVSAGITVSGEGDAAHGEELHGEDSHGDDDHDHGPVDPHVWFDPANVMHWTETIAAALGAADPDNADTYVQNAETYRRRLEELDGWIRRQVDTIPQDRRKLVVDHASLGWFAEAYGFAVVGAVIPATTDQAEPSAQDVARLVELIRREQVPAIFVGETAGRGVQAMVDAVAEEVGYRVRVGRLLTGSLAPAGQRGDSYTGFMEYNVGQIVRNLSD